MTFGKTREDIITSMCYTWDHSYGAPFQPFTEMFDCDEEDLPEGASAGIGFTDEDRKALWNNMAQVFDNDIAPWMTIGPYDIKEPKDGWQTEFTDQEKAKLRPIAETLAMLDGNAFFGNSFERDGKIIEWYEMYLPNAAALYNGNGGDDGWAGESSINKG